MGLQTQYNLSRSNNLCRSSSRGSESKTWDEKRLSGHTFYSQASIITPARQELKSIIKRSANE